MLTQRDLFLELDEVMQLLMWVEHFDGKIPPPAIIKPKPLWTGKQMISLIMPKVNFERDRPSPKTSDPYFHEHDGKIIIINGEVLSGIICKKSVGTGESGLVHICMMEKGFETTRIFMSYF